MSWGKDHELSEMFFRVDSLSVGIPINCAGSLAGLGLAWGSGKLCSFSFYWSSQVDFKPGSTRFAVQRISTSGEVDSDAVDDVSSGRKRPTFGGD